jgi:hypothetical protein
MNDFNNPDRQALAREFREAVEAQLLPKALEVDIRAVQQASRRLDRKLFAKQTRINQIFIAIHEGSGAGQRIGRLPEPREGEMKLKDIVGSRLDFFERQLVFEAVGVAIASWRLAAADPRMTTEKRKRRRGRIDRLRRVEARVGDAASENIGGGQMKRKEVFIATKPLNGNLPSELCRLRAVHHVRDAARILSDGTHDFPLEKRGSVADCVRQWNRLRSISKAWEVTMSKGQPHSADGQPIVSVAVGGNYDWGMIEQVNRACTAWLLKRGIVWEEETRWR